MTLKMSRVTEGWQQYAFLAGAVTGPEEEVSNNQIWITATVLENNLAFFLFIYLF